MPCERPRSSNVELIRPTFALPLPVYSGSRTWTWLAHHCKGCGCDGNRCEENPERRARGFKQAGRVSPPGRTTSYNASAIAEPANKRVECTLPVWAKPDRGVSAGHRVVQANRAQCGSPSTAGVGSEDGRPALGLLGKRRHFGERLSACTFGILC